MSDQSPSRPGDSLAPDRPAALQDDERATYLGGGDIAAILGKSPWAGPWDVWARKTGLDTGPRDSELMYWGRAIEPAIADRYAEDHGGAELVEPSGVIRDPERPWYGGTPDRYDPARRWILECKTTDGRNAEDWADGPPEYYLLQVWWYLGLGPILFGGEPAAGADIAVLIGGNRYQVHPVPYDPEAVEAIVQIGGEWWERHIIGGEPPPVDGSKAAARCLRRRPQRSPEMLPAGPEILPAVNQYRAARYVHQVSEEKKREAANAIRAYIGDAAGIAGPDWAIHCREDVNGVRRLRAVFPDQPNPQKEDSTR